MEAASYRAARDRWSGYGEAPQTPLQRFISADILHMGLVHALMGACSERVRSAEL